MTIASHLPSFVVDPFRRRGASDAPAQEALLLPGYAAAQLPPDGDAAGAGAALTAVGQAYVFTPPSEEDAIGPYRGPFAVFRACRLDEDQERLLVKRGYYFKGIPYSGNVYIHLDFDPGSPSAADAVLPLSDAQRLDPPVSVPPASVATRPNGFVKINHTWTNVPSQNVIPAFQTNPLSGPPVQLHYRVSIPAPSAPIDEHQALPPIAVEEPQAASHLVVAPTASLDQSRDVVGRHVAVISDIDDVLKDTQVSIHPRQALIDTFTREYKPLPGTAQLFRELQQSAASTSTHATFHYISGTPIPLAPALLPFLTSNYPPGSLTLRPVTSFDFESVTNLLTDALENEYRYNAICEILNAYPHALVVLFGDTSKHAFQTYLRVVKEFPERIKCLYVRKLGKHPLRIGGDEANLTQEKMVKLVREMLPLEMWGRAERMVVVYDEATELEGRADWLFL